MEQTNEDQGRSRRGFAAMDPEKQKQIAKKGGRTAHKLGVAHKWSAEEAKEAGKKGGRSRRSNSSKPDMP